MIDWLNKQNFLVVVLLVSLIFGTGIFLVALLSGITLEASIYVALSLGALSLVGFYLVRFTINRVGN